MTLKPIVGKFVDIAGFKAHVDALVFTGWQPAFVIVHNTSEPDLSTYAGWRAHPEKHGNWTPEQWGRNLAGYYGGMGWSTGPHAFVCPDGVLLFSPFTAPGTHSPAWNSRSWGIETVGEFERETFAGSPSEQNLVAVLGILHTRLGLNPADYHFGVRGLHFHKEDPVTTHKSCPGAHMVKKDLVAAVVDYIERAHPGEHHQVPADAHTSPPAPPAAAPRRMTGITATEFGGAGDAQESPYGGMVDPNQPQVALPARVPSDKRRVRVIRLGKSVVCLVNDVGPWNMHHAYWDQPDGRPDAEAQHRDGVKAENGRVPTNPAGIDLTRAALDALGVPGAEGTRTTMVDWEFIP